MGKVILGTSMSLDGFINDRSGSVEALYPDLAALNETEPYRESMQNTGAVVMGRNSFAMADDPDTFADHYEYQVPIFVLTHAAPKKKPKENDRLTFTFVTDGIESAIAQAKAAAGEKDVTIIGAASTSRQCIQAGLADELHIDIVPVLLGSGLRLFDYSEMEPIQLERLQVMELPGGRTHLRFRFINKESDLPKLAAPAQRALAAAGITRLDQLTRISEAELAQLHGIGPNAIKTLRLALEEKELLFANRKAWT